MRDLKKQFVWQYGMKNQDALELMKALTDAPDLYSRRNMLAKAIHAHVTSFQSAQLVRQWLTAVRSMTTQHVHKQHDLKLRLEQQAKLHEKTTGTAAAGTGTAAEGHAQRTYVRGPYKKGGNQATGLTPSAAAASSAAASKVVDTAGKTMGLIALDKLAYYWRKKLADAKASNGPFPSIKGATPSKALLQLQLQEIEKEWNTPAMTAACLRIGASHPPSHGGEKKQRSGAPPTKESIAAAAAAAVNLEAQDSVQKQLAELRQHQSEQLAQLQAMQAQMSPEQFEQARVTVQGHTAAKIAQLEQQLQMLRTQAASAAAAAAAAAAEAEEDEEHLHDSGVDSDGSSVYDLPLPNITLTKLGGGRYKIKPPRVFAHLVPVGAAPEVVAASLAATGARVPPGFAAGAGAAAASAAKASKKRSRKSSGAPAAAAAGGSGETDDDGASSVSASVTGGGRSSTRRGPTIRLRKAGSGKFTVVGAQSQQQQQHDDMAD